MAHAPLHRSAPVERFVSLTLLGVALLMLVLHAFKSLHGVIDYDEGYNLQVVDSLARFVGYASYGALRGGGPWFFDPHITTGPVVLLPLAVVWKLTDGNIAALRAFMLIFLWLYVYGLFYVVRHAAKHVESTAIPIALATCLWLLPVGNVLGELPAAAFLMLAACALIRRKIFWGALLAGLAVQSKLSFGLAGVAILVAFFTTYYFENFQNTRRTVLLAFAAFAAPSVVFEIFRFITLGSLPAYRASVAELLAFLSFQDVNILSSWLEPHVLGNKLFNLAQVYSRYAWWAVWLSLFMMVCALWAFANPATKPEGDDADAPAAAGRDMAGRTDWIVIGTLVLAAISMLWGWLTKSTQTIARQALPFLLIALPLMAYSGLRLWSQVVERASNPYLLRLTGMILKMVLYALVLLGLVAKARFLFFTMDQTLGSPEEQRRVAALIHKTQAHSMYVDGWWQNPELQLLSGVPGLPLRVDRPQLLVVQAYQVAASGKTWADYESQCREVLDKNNDHLICWAQPKPPLRFELPIRDWGPREVTAGHVPGVQPDGGAGYWFKMDATKPEDIGPVRVYLGDTPANLELIQPDGQMITASVPSRVFRTPGAYPVVIEQLATGRRQQVGVFQVLPRKNLFQRIVARVQGKTVQDEAPKSAPGASGPATTAPAAAPASAP